MATVDTTPTYQVSLPKYVTKSSFSLGLAEKPTAAKRLAEILDSKSKKVAIKVSKKENGDITKLPSINAYFVKSDNKPVVIIPALGHLFTLVQDGVGWQYPVYDFKWIANHLASKQKPLSKFDQRIEATVEAMRHLTQLTDDYIIMTDYDEEGEVIGGNILAQLAGEDSLQEAKRMKYSSFAKKEILEAFTESMQSSINFGMYNRGLMRHYLDWLWGINLSRALMLALKNTSGNYLTLSTGRVQGPTLSFVSQRMQDINSFVPVPYFKLLTSIKLQGEQELEYNQGLVSKQSTAKKVVKTVSGGLAEVLEIRSKRRELKPPVPFNLSKLQSDAFRHYKLSPSRTLKAAENLYLDAAISYPRTESEKYPSDMNHQSVLQQLGKIQGYGTTVKKIIKKLKKPKDGKKKDPAHPCIYPTGSKPPNLRGDQKKVFDLIVRRYFSTFGSPAIMEYNRIEFDISGEQFHLSGKRTVKPGWKALAGRYGKSRDKELPKVAEGETFSVINCDMEESFSRSPPYYNQSSLLKQMEAEQIGTKATRSEIIQSLFDRKYLRGDPIVITPVGEIVNQVLKSYSNQVISVELSRTLEKMGNLLEESINSNNNEFELADAIVQGIQHLHEMLNGLQENEELVGSLITKELKSQRKQASELGICPTCKTGTLRIVQSQSSGKRFVGCSEYFNDKACEQTFPLPQEGRLEPIKEPCENDGYPLIKVFRGKRPWILCLEEGPLINNSKEEKNGKKNKPKTKGNTNSKQRKGSKKKSSRGKST